MHIFDSLYLSNYFLYTKQKVPLANQGLIIVTGNYEYKNKSNAAGKSLLFSGIPALAYADFPVDKAAHTKDFRLQLKAQLPFSNEMCTSKITYANTKYVISKDNRLITPARKKDVKALLLSMFPEESLFYATTFVTQFSGVLNTIIEGTPAARSKTIESFIDLSKVDRIKTILKKRSKVIARANDRIRLYKEIEKEAEEFLEKYKDITVSKIDRIKKIRRGISTQIRDYAKKITKLKARKRDYNRYKDLRAQLKTDKSINVLVSSIKTLKKELVILHKLNGIREAIELYVEAGKPKLYSKIIFLPLSIKSISLRDREPIAEIDIKDILSGYHKLKYRLEKVYTEIANMKKLVNSKRVKCPTCLSSVSTDNLLNEIKSTKYLLKVLKERYKREERKLRLIRSTMDISKEFLSAGITTTFVDKNLDKLEVDPEKAKRRLSFLRRQLGVKRALKLLVDVEYTQQDNRELGKSIKKLDELLLKKNDVDSVYINLKAHFKMREEKEKQCTQIKQKRIGLEKSIKEDIVHLPLVSKAVSSRQLKADSLFNFYKFLTENWNLYSRELFDN